jgi:N-methylhydantoinase B
MQTAGAGGFGAPALRDPDRVWADVQSGLVSRAAARDIYKVAFHDDLTVDRPATAALRQMA